MKQISSTNDQKRQQIIKAASHLISKFGYDKITLDDIAQLIRIKKTTLYYYYRNKDEIIQEVVRTETERYLETLKKNLAKQTAIKAKITAYIRTKLNCIQEMINIYDLSKQRFLEISERIRSMIAQILETETQYLTDVINQAINNKELRECNAQRLAEAIVTISEAVKYKELYRSKILNLNEMDFNKIEEEINYILGLVFEGLSKQQADVQKL